MGQTSRRMADLEPTGNPDVRNLRFEVLSDAWAVLRRATFELRAADGSWTEQQREAYDRGNGATILLHDPARGTVLLTRQFRLPAYVNGHADGMLVEAPAGLLDDEHPDEGITREVREETGFEVRNLRRVFELYMSPGSVTERVAFYVAEYDGADRADAGGGVAEEGEEIEVLELPLAEACAGVAAGEIVDGKTVLLLQWAQRHVLGA